MRYFFSTLILFLSCTTLPEDVPGCTNSNACNFNPEANEDDGSCADLDCQGNCDGEAYIDPCGYCDADPQNDCLVECGDIMAEFSIGENEFQCENGFTEEGYDCNDLTTILNIMYSNPHSLHEGMDADLNKIITVYEYGVQQWSNGRLTLLNLSYNETVVTPTFCNFRLTTLPEDIGDLSALITLSLNNNEFLSLPESIVNLASLEQLFLASNQITSLPDSIGNLINLKEMVISYNRIENLPQSIGSLVSLEQLWTQQNQLVDLPQSIGNLSQLQRLYLDYNSLQSLPESIGELDNLIFLSLDNNNLLFLPEELCSIYSGLVIFSAEQNFLCEADDPSTENYEGSVPICIDEDIGSQTCEGCPPHYFKAGSPLVCVYENDYNILQNFLDLNPESQSLPNNTGIPEEAFECVNTDWWENGRLVEITFHHKQLTSIIPENIGDLTMLEILRLTGNDLNGEMPDNITNLENLSILKLGSNKLSGGLPENIGALSKIDTLWLDNNNLGCYEYNYECDPFGRESYCCVTHCDDINECSGDIPQSITNLNGLQHLQLQINNLSGFIPKEIGEMDSLKYLYLDNNQLSGEIPQSIGNLEILRRLYLYNNNLSGQIPESICNIYDINENLRLYLDNNQLCPGPSGYPECVPLYQLGLTEDNVIKQDTTNCNE